MPRVVVTVPADSDRELRAAGLDPTQIVRDAARRGIDQALAALRTGVDEAQSSVVVDALATPRIRPRTPTRSLDAVGFPDTDRTGKIGVPVVRADELDESEPG